MICSIGYPHALKWRVMAEGAGEGVSTDHKLDPAKQRSTCWWSPLNAF